MSLHQTNFIGWILFVVPSIGFIIASIGNLLAMFGSAFFLSACPYSMIPSLRDAA